MPAKGKKKLVFDLLPEDHEEFMAKAREAGMSGIDYFRRMRAPIPIFRHETSAGEEREKHIRFAMFYLDLMYKSNGGQRTSELAMKEEWQSRLDKIEDCIRALRALPMPGTPEDCPEAQIPSDPAWVKSGSGAISRSAVARER